MQPIFRFLAFVRRDFAAHVESRCWWCSQCFSVPQHVSRKLPAFESLLCCSFPRFLSRTKGDRREILTQTKKEKTNFWPNARQRSILRYERNRAEFRKRPWCGNPGSTKLSIAVSFLPDTQNFLGSRLLSTLLPGTHSAAVFPCAWRLRNSVR